MASALAAAAAAVNEFLSAIDAEEMPVSSEIGSLALNASMTYGKAVGHPADLNFGDCFAYACAKSAGVGLAYKGNDFAQTDLS
ncbi:MAG: type II toxin-antitoxin system VapC family toxin [Pseudaminobacter sp.]|nr:type II toxin-antitoxin system VapC family toxin [Pseudaminobacter sp.]